MKINNFRGDLTDISAKKETLAIMFRSPYTDMPYLCSRNMKENIHSCKYSSSTNSCDGMDNTALVAKNLELANLEAGCWRNKGSVISKPEIYANLTEQPKAYAHTRIWCLTACVAQSVLAFKSIALSRTRY